MGLSVQSLHCPNCGAPMEGSATQCKYCRTQVVVTSFSQAKSLSIDPQRFAKFSRYASQAARAEDVPQDESNSLHKSAGLLFLSRGQYDKALAELDAAYELNLDDSEAMYYHAVARLGGKKPFVNTRKTINGVREDLEAALAIEERGIYYYFLAVIGDDYFARKSLNITPDYQEYLQMAHRCGVGAADVNDLYAMLGIEQLAELSL